MQGDAPKALGQDSIVEAVFEIRFTPRATSAGDLLPGLMYPTVGKRYPTVLGLPLAQIPRAMRQTNHAFVYQPLNALVGTNMRLALGDQVMSVSVSKPYPRWPSFRELIGEAVIALERTEIVREIERISLKYVNVLPPEKGTADLSTLRLKLELGDFPLRPQGQIVRAEIEHGGSTHIVQVTSGTSVSVNLPGSTPFEVKGVMLDVDAVTNGPFKCTWSAIEEAVERAHAAEKDVFFGLLTKETLNRMRPIYA